MHKIQTNRKWAKKLARSSGSWSTDQEIAPSKWYLKQAKELTSFEM
jgi:hypothetical protein